MTNKEKMRQYTAEEMTAICQKWAAGARNFGCAYAEVIDALNAIPCTSFCLTPEEVEALLEKDGEE